MIRAHVSATSGQADAALAYLAAAREYLSPTRGSIVAIGGLQGTGKSTLARLVAPDLGAAPGAVILRSDELRKRMHGIAPEERLPTSAYSEDVNQVVNAALIRHAREIASNGHAVVLDATFLDERMRQAAEAAAESAAMPFLGVWLHAPMAELERRVSQRRDDASDATLEVLRRSATADTGKMDWVWIDATDKDAAVAAIRAAIPERAESQG
jgi:predicted kinase